MARRASCTARLFRKSAAGAARPQHPHGARRGLTFAREREESPTRRREEEVSVADDTQPRDIQMPDHTRVQLAAVVQAVIAVAVAFGLPISDEQSIALIALSG